MSEKVITIYRQSWKAFTVEYVCAIAIFFMALSLPTKFSYLQPFLFIFSGLALGTAEFNRYLTKYIFTKKKIIVVSGLIKQSKKHIYFHPLNFVPDLHVTQTQFQRIMGFGDIFLKGGDGDEFRIRNVSNPHEVYNLIEDLIAKNRNLD